LMFSENGPALQGRKPQCSRWSQSTLHYCHYCRSTQPQRDRGQRKYKNKRL